MDSINKPKDYTDQYGHPRIPYRGHYNREECDKRRTWIEQFTNSQLSIVGEWWTNEGSGEDCSCTNLRGNIENPIGLAKIPIGIAGPLLIHGDHINGYALCPYATTEGALVASATRGAALLTRSGGVTCRVLEKNMSRAPVFVMESVHDAEKLKQWTKSNIDRLQAHISDYSNHTKLLDIQSYTLGSLLYMTFIYDTGDAAGQNMVTSASWNCCTWLMKVSEKEIGVRIKEFIVVSVASGDKKNSVLNLVHTRGVHVVAEAWIPDSLIRSTLKTTAVDLHTTYLRLVHGGIRIGNIGTSINPSNTIAAVFAAAGQDLGSVGECSGAHFLMEQAKPEDIKKRCPLSVEGEGGVYVSFELPTLTIGTVGGGTSLPTQRECLQMMGCYGRGGVYRLAEIIVGYCLSLDISSLGSIANGTFHLAHDKLGRNRPNNGLRQAHLDSLFFQKIIGEKGKLIEFRPFSIDTRNSIISEISKNERVKLVGHFGYDIIHKTSSGEVKSLKVVIKSKPTDIEICNMVNNLAQGCGFTLATVYEANKGITGFRHSSEREVEISSSIVNVPAVKRILPQVYHTINDMKKDIHVIVMEYMDSERFTLLNTVNDINIWTDRDIKVVLRDLACFHASFMSTEYNHILKSPWLEEMDRDRMVVLQPLWSALLDHAHSEFPEIWNKENTLLLKKAIQNIPNLWKVLLAADKTLVHNDCNPRNLCIHLPSSSYSSPSVQQTIQDSTGSSNSIVEVPFSDPRSLCLYDWELCRVDVPQHDVVELLAFILPPDTVLSRRNEFVEFYRLHLEYYTGRTFPVDRFLEVYNVASVDFAVNRLLMYTMVHTFKDYGFLPRVVTSHMNYLNQIKLSATSSKL